MAYLFRNNASTTLSGDILATTDPITVVSAADFPNPTGGDSFRIAIEDSTGAFEYCDVTAVSGNQYDTGDNENKGPEICHTGIGKQKNETDGCQDTANNEKPVIP